MAYHHIADTLLTVELLQTKVALLKSRGSVSWLDAWRLRSAYSIRHRRRYTLVAVCRAWGWSRAKVYRQRAIHTRALQLCDRIMSNAAVVRRLQDWIATTPNPFAQNVHGANGTTLHAELIQSALPHLTEGTIDWNRQSAPRIPLIMHARSYGPPERPYASVIASQRRPHPLAPAVHTGDVVWHSALGGSRGGRNGGGPFRQTGVVAR